MALKLEDMRIGRSGSIPDPLPTGHYHGVLSLAATEIETPQYGKQDRVQFTFSADQKAGKTAQWEPYTEENKAAGFLSGWDLGSPQSNFHKFAIAAIGPVDVERVISAGCPVTIFDGWTGVFTVMHVPAQKTGQQPKAMPVNCESDEPWLEKFHRQLKEYESI